MTTMPYATDPPPSPGPVSYYGNVPQLDVVQGSSSDDIAALQQDVADLQAMVNVLAAKNNNSFSKSIASPAGTTSAAPVCMGLNLSFIPVDSTRILFTVNGSVSNNQNSGVGRVQMVYGDGASPDSGTLVSAVNGVFSGQPLNQISKAAGDSGAFAMVEIGSGLTAGQMYWIDLAICSPSGGTTTVTNVDVNAISLIDETPVTRK